ncbi:AMP-dependent synthetase [Shewanella sairae]|uniref:AMP-dependent synthetase n=1 Tax=Shewanella sairae TaxID=190310 RepID=A0ABQ4PQI7_9GAMM|nr:AMP-binding protein [Shewanella sairae]MCL1129272.1 AMP-binding protein [Shewanella sairae]GIU51262.1 AMP-dependent synthetase [Shewanella sairae]
MYWQTQFDSHIAAGLGERAALLYGDKQLSYSQLQKAIQTRKVLLLAKIAPGQVCALALQPTFSSVITYLASMDAGIPLLLLDGQQTESVNEQLMTAYRVTWLLDVADGDDREIATNMQGVRHDLSLLLSTSGSTGAPKAVMLSRKNIISNAKSISEYLPMRTDDIAITCLPLHYSYGLSILNSHLWLGACILLSDESMLSRAFWQQVTDFKVTVLSGVPFSYQMLKNLRIERMNLPSLRYLTQAGGKLPSTLVSHFTALAKDKAWQLYLMYGQTEATARIAYLPPEHLASDGDCIGKAIPGGRLYLKDELGALITRPGIAGELFYQGDNVMLGYASNYLDLLGDSYCQELATGDIAELTTSGLYRICGRKRRFIKVRGKRLSLDHIESLLETAQGGNVWALGKDEALQLVYDQADDMQRLADFAVQYLGLHPSLFKLQHIAELPRLSNGKPDYQTLSTIMENQ